MQVAVRCIDRLAMGNVLHYPSRHWIGDFDRNLPKHAEDVATATQSVDAAD